MIHLHLTPEALTRTRFTYSPLIDTLMSYRTLKHHPQSLDTPAHRRWAADAQRALHGVSLPLMDALLLMPHYIPDFLTPTPDHFETDIECELYHLQHTPHVLVRKYLDGAQDYCDAVMPEQDTWSPVSHDPSLYLPRLVDEIRRYWQLAIAPHWSAMLSIVEGDILFRARQLALDGTARLFNDLNPRAAFDGTALRLDKSHHAAASERHFIIDHEGLHLIPSVFNDTSLMWQVTPDYNPMLIYGARGLGTWQQKQPQLDESLELLLGAGRASVLQDLTRTPATTTELAHNLHLTASAVSQHLGLLQRAGLVRSQRSGKRVYYQLSAKGEDLVRLFR